MSLFQRLLETFRSGRLERELDEEMRFHVEMRAEAYRQQGLSPEEARTKALRRFGSPLNARERVRDIHVLPWLDSVRQDIVLGLRLLRRSPALAVVSILSLGLAIGAATGIFLVADGLLLRPLPVSRPEELLIPQWRSTEWPDMGIWGSGDSDGNSWSFSYPLYEDFRRVAGIDVGGFQDLSNAVTQIGGEAGTTNGAFVTGSLFRVLGLKPAAGRLLVDGDDVPGAAPVVVLSHRLWTRAFGADPAAVGKTIVLNGRSFAIVGVAPRSFFGMQPGRWADIYVACWWVTTLPQFAHEPMLTSERFWWLQLVARPRSGADPAALRAALARQFDLHVKPLIKQPKQYAAFGMRSGERGFSFMDEEGARAVRIVAALVGLVFLIACSNVAGLLLASAQARRREAAMRLALGARPLRLVRQHLTESLVLAVLSGAAALPFAQWFASTLLGLAPGRDEIVLDVGLGWRALAWALGASLLAGLFVGAVPALALARARVSAALRAGSGVLSGWRRTSLGRSLVGLQIALSLLLLVVAGLFVRTLANLHALPLGFNAESVVLFNLEPTAAGYSPAQTLAATDRIAARVAQLPGVARVAWSSFALLDNFTWNARLTFPGEGLGREGPGRKRPPCNLLWVGPGFHDTLQVPLLAGRRLDERDGPTAPKVAVVNQAFVSKYLGQGPALGRTFVVDVQRDPQPYEIVGIVRNTKYARLRRAEDPIAFLSYAQQQLPLGPSFVLRARGDASNLARDVAAVVRQLEPALPVIRFRTYEQQIAQQLWMERSLSLVASAFGLVALFLAAIGLYGAIAFAVARRTSELGVRLALGASRGRVLRLVLGDSAKVIVPGAVVGMAAALAATRLVGSILFGLKPTDPATIVLAVLLLLAVSAVAAYLPARRAAATDPVVALRCE